MVVAGALCMGLALAGCETATPYQPLTKGSAVAGGFTDQQLDADHFRVTFQGNSLTDRETVETYLLYRAAELTVNQGFDWFEMVDRHTDKDKKTYIDSDSFYGPGYAYGYWRPYWSYYGGGFGWRGLGSVLGRPRSGPTRRRSRRCRSSRPAPRSPSATVPSPPAIPASSTPMR